MEQWEWKVEDAKAHREMLLKYNWEWHCSFNMKYRVDHSKAEDYLAEWRLMGIKDHILIAYMGIYNPVPFPHVHLLVWGKRNRFRQTLLDLNHKKWEKAWSRLTKCDAHIEPIYSRGVVDGYLADKNMRWESCERINSYPNKRLLGKAMIRKPIIILPYKFAGES